MHLNRAQVKKKKNSPLGGHCNCDPAHGRKFFFFYPEQFHASFDTSSPAANSALWKFHHETSL